MAGDNTISWSSSLQSVVALSTTESEYMALVEAVKEGMWLRDLAEELRFRQDTVEISCDSQSALCLAKNCWGKLRRYYFPPGPRQDLDLQIPVLGTPRIPSIGYPGIGSRNRLQLQEKANCR